MGWIVSEIAAWSDPSESSQDTCTSPSCAEIKAGSLARARSMIEGLALSARHVGVSGGLMQVTPLSPIHSVKVLAHEDGVRPVSDHRWVCVLKSLIRSVGRCRSSS